MISLFHKVSQLCSRVTTEQYSTSFASAIRLLHKDLREPVYNIYGLVRFADEIVDSFHDFNKEELLAEFKAATFQAIERRISLNPILHSFQLTMHQYGISRQLVEAFFTSMEMDLLKTQYNRGNYQAYIYGSAEVVGLMCLHVFCDGNKLLFDELTPYARSLGAAFQKVNFLRDLKADFNDLNRSYFPGVDFANFTNSCKENIQSEIAADFRHAYIGVLRLPWKARFGVYVAYKYYSSLFTKICKTNPQQIMESRIRIPNYRKAMILVRAGVKNQLKLI